MPRTLDTATLDEAAKTWAAHYALPGVFSRRDPKVAVAGRDWAIQSLYNAHFKDEHEYLAKQVKEWLGPRHLTAFEADAKAVFAPRDDKVFAGLLADRLAIDRKGNHVAGRIGRVVIGQRPVGATWHYVEVETLDSIRRRKRLGLAKDAPGARETYVRRVKLLWPIYAGEGDERAAGRIKQAIGAAGPGADPLPPGTPGLSLGALASTLSNEVVVAMADAAVDRLDEGTGAAVISIYEASQPTNPDVAVGAQTLGAKLVMSDPAFGAAADGNPGGLATADTITDDSSADATITAAWYRVSATNDGATPLDDHMDGSVGTSSANLVLNTVALVSGANVAISSYTFNVPETA